MPTFQLYRFGAKVDEMSGADPQRLERLIQSANCTLKDPGDMSIKELKHFIATTGLASKAVGLNEKQEFIQLIRDYIASFS
jgi:hypothetical protein